MSESKLIRLKTDLKSLKYGKDRPGSSDSGQPYITTAIPNRSAFVSTSDDGFIRGGMVTATRSSLIDKERISRFFKDKPKGPLFIQRQIGLQFSNPKLEVKKYPSGGAGLIGGVLSLAASTFNVVNELVPGPTRLYNNGFNTLAQIGANAFGQHFNRHGLAPVQDDNSKYLAVVKFNNENGNNRLVGLKNKLLKENNLDNILSNRFLNSVNFVVGNINALFGTRISTVGLQAPELTIDNYQGGPGSVYGRGRTLIRRFDITNTNFIPGKKIPIINWNRATGVSDQWSASAGSFAPLVRSRLTKLEPNRPNTAPDYVNQTSVKYVSPSAKSYQAIRDISNNLENNQRYNVQGTLRQGKTIQNPNFKAYLDGKKTMDLANRYDPNVLSIVFKIINPFNQTEDNIVFSAYMNGFRDNFDASWSEYNYIGRSESFYTYGKFKRNVSFNLDIPIFNKAELLDKYRALGQLASTTAGAYSDNNQLLSGILIKLYIGNHIKGEYGILNSISYEIPNETSWDIDARLAMLVKTTFNFTIVHNKLPEYKKNRGFYDYVNSALVTKTNTIVNTPDSSDADLIQYFSNDSKPILPTSDFASALDNARTATDNATFETNNRRIRELLNNPPTVFEENTTDTITQFASNQA